MNNFISEIRTRYSIDIQEVGFYRLYAATMRPIP